MRARRPVQEKSMAGIGRRFPVPVVPIPFRSYKAQGLEILTDLGEQVYGTGGCGRCRMDGCVSGSDAEGV